MKKAENIFSVVLNGELAGTKEGAVSFRCRSRDFVLALLLGTVESKIAAKKTHKMEKSADFFRRISTLIAIYLRSPPRL
jgi:hypothetical protein